MDGKVDREPDEAAGAKRNLTVQLDEEVIRRAKALAARRGMSVSALVAQRIAEMTAADERYERARESAISMMDRARDRGGRRWVREDLYDERLNRFGA